MTVYCKLKSPAIGLHLRGIHQVQLKIVSCRALKPADLARRRSYKTVNPKRSNRRNSPENMKFVELETTATDSKGDLPLFTLAEKATNPIKVTCLSSMGEVCQLNQTQVQLSQLYQTPPGRQNFQLPSSTLTCEPQDIHR